MKDVLVTWMQSPDGEHYELLTERQSAFRAKCMLAPDGELQEADAQTAFCLDADGDAVAVADGLPEYVVSLHLFTGSLPVLATWFEGARVCIHTHLH